MANDKRRANREKHDSVIELLDDSGRLKGSGRLIDFSRSGIAFSSEESFSRGEKIRARLRLLGKGVLDVSGTVVWSRSSAGRRYYGARFDSVQNTFPTGERFQ